MEWEFKTYAETLSWGVKNMFLLDLTSSFSP